MQSASSAPATDDSEQSRAFLQARVALFWKVMFFIALLGSGLAALGTIAQRGLDFWVTLVGSAQSGLFWWLCGRGQWSVRASRLLESLGLVLYVTGGASIGRFILVGVTRDRALVDPSALMMADAYVTMIQLFGTALMVGIRAALVPSRPRRTLIVTTLVGIPPIVMATFFAPAESGWLRLRPFDSGVLPWLPGSAVVMWVFVVVTCVVISTIIYGLQAEVREARYLGQYVLEHKIGEGGMGEVYRARHGMMRRPSAIKLLRRDRASDATLRRFEREVQLTARLTHPNTITLFDYGRTRDGIFYYAMELLDGANLQRIVELSGPQPAARVARILSMACGALIEAHGVGVIHRDIKPANLMLCRQGVHREKEGEPFGRLRRPKGRHQAGRRPGLAHELHVLRPRLFRRGRLPPRADRQSLRREGAARRPAVAPDRVCSGPGGHCVAYVLGTIRNRCARLD